MNGVPFIRGGNGVTFIASWRGAGTALLLKGMPHPQQAPPPSTLHSSLLIARDQIIRVFCLALLSQYAHSHISATSSWTFRPATSQSLSIPLFSVLYSDHSISTYIAEHYLNLPEEGGNFSLIVITFCFSCYLNWFISRRYGMSLFTCNKYCICEGWTSTKLNTV